MELSPQATEAIDHLEELNGGVAALATLFDPELKLERGDRDNLSALLLMIVRATAELQQAGPGGVEHFETDQSRLLDCVAAVATITAPDREIGADVRFELASLMAWIAAKQMAWLGNLTAALRAQPPAGIQRAA